MDSERDELTEATAEETSATTPAETSTALTTLNLDDLNKESLELLNQAIAETDVEKAKDLTYLFNMNQNKKVMVRTNKLNDLLDVLTEQLTKRATERPDEVTTAELMTGLKTVSDLIDKGRHQVMDSTAEPAPLIQINQQNNEVNVGDDNKPSLSRASRENVKNAILDILHKLPKEEAPVETVEIIDAEEENTND